MPTAWSVKSWAGFLLLKHREARHLAAIAFIEARGGIWPRSLRRGMGGPHCSPEADTLGLAFNTLLNASGGVDVQGKSRRLRL